MILVKTETGQQVLKDRSVPLSPRQRTAFILFDGKRSVDDVIAAGAGIAREDIDQMVALGLLSPLGGAAVAETPASAAEGAPKAGSGRSSQQRYTDAYPIATRLTASLGLKGVRLNLQVEGAGGYEDLVALAPKIRAAVGAEKAEPLDRALYD
jgi:hypothetical protein